MGSGNESHIIRVMTDDFPLKMGEMNDSWGKLILIWNVASTNRF